MSKRIKLGLILGVLVILTAGCASQERRVDRFFGTSYEMALQNQQHNPEAGITDGPAIGLDGDIATQVVNRYKEGYEKPAPKTETYSVSFEGVEVK